MAAWTHEQLATLKAAAAKGVTSLRVGNEQVNYGSVADMLKLIAAIERELAGRKGPMLATYPTERGFR